MKISLGSPRCRTAAKGRAASRSASEANESVPILIRLIAKPATAPVRHVKPVLQSVAADGLCQKPGDRSVELGGQAVGLGSAAREGVRDDDFRRIDVAVGGRPVTADQNAELRKELWRDHRPVIEDELVLAESRLRCRLRKRRAAHANIVLPAVLEVHLPEHCLILVELVADSKRAHGIHLRRRHVLVDGALRPLGEHNGDEVFLFSRARTGETTVFLLFATGPNRLPSKMRRCSCGRCAAKASRALRW